MAHTKEIVRSEGRNEITFADLHQRIMSFNRPLSVLERLLIAQLVKEYCIDPKKIDVLFGGDLFIDTKNKSDRGYFNAQKRPSKNH